MIKFLKDYWLNFIRISIVIASLIISHTIGSKQMFWAIFIIIISLIYVLIEILQINKIGKEKEAIKEEIDDVSRRTGMLGG